jgi:uncharacterized protein (DUF433 family)
MQPSLKPLLSRIVRVPEVLDGMPVVKGTRIPISIVLERLATGATAQELLNDFAFLRSEDIAASLVYAVQLISQLPPLDPSPD